MSYRLAYRRDVLLAPETASTAMVQCLYVPGYKYYEYLVNLKDCFRTMVISTKSAEDMKKKLSYFIDIFEQAIEAIHTLDLTQATTIPIRSKVTSVASLMVSENYESSDWSIRYNRKSIDLIAVYKGDLKTLVYHSATNVYGSMQKHKEHMLSKLNLVLKEIKDFKMYLSS